MESFLVNPDHKNLKRKLENFNFENPPVNPIEFAAHITQKLLEYNGMSLSANQLGYDYNCFVIKSNPMLVMYNAKIVDTGEKMIYLDEQSLTYPGLTVKIKRPETIKLRFTLPNGETKTEKYTGLTSRLVQHEMDHMNGIIFYNNANYYDRAKSLKKYKRPFKNI